MLAPTEKPERLPEQPQAEPKHRTITLTNRAPISIIEADWPVTAEGTCGYDVPDAPFGWTINIRVRHERGSLGRTIIHAKYVYWDDDADHGDENQIVRVGRVLSQSDALNHLWQDILQVGDELRIRIANAKLAANVIYAVDACFAALPAHKY
jgi:hypothetical protein